MLDWHFSNCWDVLVLPYRQLTRNGWTIQQLLENGLTSWDLKTGGLTPQQFLQSGFTLPQLREEAGFDFEQLHRDGLTLRQILGCGFKVQEMRARTKQCNLHIYGIYGTYMSKFTAQAFLDAGVTLHELREAGFTPGELRADGLTAQQCLDAGFATRELNSAGFSLKQIMCAGVTLEDLLGSGYTAVELRYDGLTPQEFLDAGSTLRQLREAGYQPQELIEKGLTLGQILGCGFTVQDLRLQYNVRFTAQAFLDAGVTLHELREAEIHTRWTATSESAASWADCQTVLWCWLWHPWVTSGWICIQRDCECNGDVWSFVGVHPGLPAFAQKPRLRLKQNVHMSNITAKEVINLLMSSCFLARALDN